VPGGILNPEYTGLNVKIAVGELLVIIIFRYLYGLLLVSGDAA
jgi:hypothetical protein